MQYITCMHFTFCFNCIGSYCFCATPLFTTGLVVGLSGDFPGLRESDLSIISRMLHSLTNAL